MLTAQNLSKQYNGVAALSGLNLQVNPGDIYCLLGANGAGKSTTINLFLGFIAPSSGSAAICGIDVAEHPEAVKQFVAYVPENLMLYPYFTGLENLDFFCRVGGHRYRKPELREWLREAGLQSEAWDRRVSGYSKGMRQKVGVALALARKAKVLLLDEPTSGLDPQSSNEFSELLLRLKGKGAAVLMATHDLYRAREAGTHIGIMSRGKLVTECDPATLSFKDLEQVYLRHMHG